MSWLPLYNSWILLVALVSAFFWKLLGLGVFAFFVFGSLIYIMGEVLNSEVRHAFAFWLFILSEVAAFATLLSVCMWSSLPYLGRLSDCLELPLLGCFLLLGSSFTASTYHATVGTNVAIIYLLITMFLGSCFIGIQVWEFYDCECDLLSSVYHCACFCTVGLHFMHVVFGVIALIIVMWIGFSAVNMYYVNLVVWYWHFVDYVWLFVFIIVYAA